MLLLLRCRQFRLRAGKTETHTTFSHCHLSALAAADAVIFLSVAHSAPTCFDFGYYWTRPRRRRRPLGLTIQGSRFLGSGLARRRPTLFVFPHEKSSVLVTLLLSGLRSCSISLCLLSPLSLITAFVILFPSHSLNSLSISITHHLILS